MISTTTRVVAIILAVMGAIGALFGCYGMLGVITNLAGLNQPQIPPTMSAEQAEAMLAFVEQTQTLNIVGVFPTLLSLFVSIFMLAAGVMTLARKEVGMTPIACFAAAGVDVITLIFQGLSLALMYPHLDQFMAAIVPPGEPQMAEFMENFMGVALALSFALSALIYLGLAGFWGWAGLASRRTLEYEIMD